MQRTPTVEANRAAVLRHTPKNLGQHAMLAVFQGSFQPLADNLLIALVQMLSMIAQSSEFENVAVREEELPELDRLMHDAAPFDARGGPENRHGKVSILLQVRDASGR